MLEKAVLDVGGGGGMRAIIFVHLTLYICHCIPSVVRDIALSLDSTVLAYHYIYLMLHSLLCPPQVRVYTSEDGITWASQLINHGIWRGGCFCYYYGEGWVLSVMGSVL